MSLRGRGRSPFGLKARPSLRVASTHAARWEEEPVHKDALAVVVRIVGQQTVPLVLLLAAAVPGAPLRLGFSVKEEK